MDDCGCECGLMHMGGGKGWESYIMEDVNVLLPS